MFDFLRKNRGHGSSNPRQVARERVQSAIRRDRMEVSAPQLNALRVSMLMTIQEHLPVAPEFTEFGIQGDGDDLILTSRVRLQQSH